jgi:hypothetical protein
MNDIKNCLCAVLLLQFQAINSGQYYLLISLYTSQEKPCRVTCSNSDHFSGYIYLFKYLFVCVITLQNESCFLLVSQFHTPFRRTDLFPYVCLHLFIYLFLCKNILQEITASFVIMETLHHFQENIY